PAEPRPGRSGRSQRAGELPDRQGTARSVAGTLAVTESRIQHQQFHTGDQPLPDVVILTYKLARDYVLGTETVHALRGVDIQIRRNEFTAIMGPSGSGKSTLMNLLGCLDTPTGGE